MTPPLLTKDITLFPGDGVGPEIMQGMRDILTDAGSAKIQGAAKDLLKAEESFFVSLGENKQGFDDHLRGILQQQTADVA